MSWKCDIDILFSTLLIISLSYVRNTSNTYHHNLPVAWPLPIFWFTIKAHDIATTNMWWDSHHIFLTIFLYQIQEEDNELGSVTLVMLYHTCRFCVLSCNKLRLWWDRINLLYHLTSTQEEIVFCANYAIIWRVQYNKPIEHNQCCHGSQRHIHIAIHVTAGAW